MKSFFNELFDYNFYCNKTIIERCLETKDALPETERLFGHILNAHHIWNSRIMNKNPAYDVWQEHLVADWAEVHYENQRTSFEITSNVNDFEKRIDYETAEGRLVTRTLKDMLFHIINHSTSHRGQIAVDLRKNNINPIVLDYVNYKR